MKRLLKKQLGIGLLELMLSLAIIAILLIMATRFYTSARRGERVNETVNVIGVIKEEAGSYWYNHNSLTGGTSPFGPAYVVGSLPDRYKSGTGGSMSVLDGWGNTITINSATPQAADVTLQFNLPSLSDAQMLCARIGCVEDQASLTKQPTYQFSVASTS